MHKKCFAVLLYLVAQTVCAQRPLPDSNNEFALEFYKARSAGHKNIVVAPFSISCAIGMMYPGMGGETAEEVRNAFFFNKKVARHVDDFSDLLTDLNNSSGSLKISNSLWLNPDFNFLPSFLSINKESFGAHIENLDFSDAGKASQVINDAVEKQTEGKIKDLISPDALSGSDQVMMLTNAMYFKEAWRTSFDKSKTTKGKFYKSDGSTTQAQFMNTAGRYWGVENENFTALEFPYKDNEFSMLFIVPKGNLRDFEAQYLTHQDYLNWGFTEANFKMIHVPTFKIETDTDAIPILKDFGMKAAFGDADFTGMVSAPHVLINVISHKALIEVDEEGTVAAAATGVGAAIRSATRVMELNANKPFIFILRHNASQSILFIGKVEDPEG